MVWPPASRAGLLSERQLGGFGENWSSIDCAAGRQEVEGCMTE